LAKILSHAGESLADTYDIEGSQIGVDRLEASEVQLVHDMGSTIFSERLSGSVARAAPTALAASSSWNTILSDQLPSQITRILGLQVQVDADRVDFCSVSVRDPILGREVALWAWDTAVDAIVNVRFVDDGAGVSNSIMLRSAQPAMSMPSLLIGRDQRLRVPEISFRGLTTAFGAGTVAPILVLYLAFAELGGVSSHGLPIPGW